MLLELMNLNSSLRHKPTFSFPTHSFYQHPPLLLECNLFRSGTTKHSGEPDFTYQGKSQTAIACCHANLPAQRWTPSEEPEVKSKPCTVITGGDAGTSRGSQFQDWPKTRVHERQNDSDASSACINVWFHKNIQRENIARAAAAVKKTPANHRRTDYTQGILQHWWRANKSSKIASRKRGAGR